MNGVEVAERMFNEGRADEAKIALQQFLKECPENYRAWNDLGVIFFNEKNIEEAEKCFTEALSIREDYLDAIINIATVQQELKQWLKAAQQLEKYVRVDNRNANVFNQLGRIYLEIGKVTEALSVLKRSLEIDPNQPIILESLNELQNSRPGKYVRSIELCDQMLPEGVVNALYLNPRFNNVFQDLLDFTNLSEKELIERLLRKPQHHFESEFNWHNPQNKQQLEWFYRNSYGFLFANAVHPYWEKLDFLKPSIGSVLDYGAGVGNNAIELAKRGLQVDCLEINVLQENFIRFRAERRGLNNINFIAPHFHGRFDPINCIDRFYGAIILEDVLEHIPDYQILLRHLIDHLEVGGYIIENTKFEQDPTTQDIALHLKPSVPLEQAMYSMKLIEPFTWQKMDLSESIELKFRETDNMMTVGY